LGSHSAWGEVQENNVLMIQDWGQVGCSKQR
jgi:hypothetical protein